MLSSIRTRYPRSKSARPSYANSGGNASPDDRPASRDPHLGLRFWVQLGQIEVAGFQECSGLAVQTEVMEYPEGGLNTYTHKFATRAKYTNITLKRGLDEGQDLYEWYMRYLQGDISRQDISILLYNSEGKQVQKWDVRRAFPCKWTGPTLRADKGAIAVETLEIAHEGIIPGS